MDFSSPKHKMLERTVNGVQCVFLPLNAIDGAKLAHKGGRALAQAGELAPLVSKLGGKKAAKHPVTAPAGEEGTNARTAPVDADLDDEGIAQMVSLAQLILGAIDPALASELIAVADTQTAIDGKRKQFNAAFEGEIYSVFACVYHVMDASGFFGFSRAKS